jgi:hypothetical protein
MKQIDFQNFTLEIASKDEGEELISVDFFNSFFPYLTNIDIEIRTRKSLAYLTDSEKFNFYIKFIKNEVIAFNDAEIETLSRLFSQIDVMLKSLNIKFVPEKICLIKTTGKEEGNAGYTRNHCIIIPEEKFEKSDFQFLVFMTHELFHVYSRYSPEIRFQLYSLLGFSDNENISISPELNSIRITNPDAANFKFIINLPDEAGTVNSYAPVVFSKQKEVDESSGKGLFDYVEFGYFRLENNRIDEKNFINIKKIEGLYELNAEGQKLTETESYNHPLYEKISRNSGYIIHPEEIMADNFSLLLLSSQNSDLLNGITPLGKELQQNILKMVTQ